MREASTVEERVQGRGTIQVLLERDYLLFWGGMTISMVGMWMQTMALNWVVVNQLTRSAAVLGWINFASSVPMLLFTLLGGVAADRQDRRKILLVTQFVMMALAFVFAWLVAQKGLALWQVLLLSALGGLAAAYDMPAFQAYYPTLVRREDLSRAIALNQASFHGSRVVGPALAGLAIAWWGAPSAFIGNGLSFGAVILALLLIRTRPGPGNNSRGGMRGALAEGLRYVARDPGLQALLGLTAITTLFVFPNFGVLLPLYAREVLSTGPGGLSLLMSTSGLGALLGALALLRVAPERRVRRIAEGIAAVTVGTLILGQTRSLPLAAAATALLSFGVASMMGLVSTIIQATVPDALRGRVMSVHGMMFVGIMPFAALIVPGVAERFGLPLEMQLAGVLFGVLGTFFLRRLWAATEAPTERAAPRLSVEAEAAEKV
jgi:MFS family permease